MTIKIGQRIKELRVKTGITQEQFANHLGISAQAVCRWENESCYPDMELIPAISLYFGVSADYLLDINNIAAEEKSKSIENQWNTTIKDGKPQKAMDIINDALLIMPSNYHFMNLKALTLMILAGFAENEGDKEHTESYITNTEKILKTVIAGCSSDTDKLDAKHYLISILAWKNNTDEVLEIAKNLPDLQTTRSSVLYRFAGQTEEEKVIYSRKYLYELFQEFYYCVVNMVSIQSLPQNEKIELCQKLLEMLNIIFGNDGYGEFEFLVDKLYKILYQCTGNEEYNIKDDLHFKLYIELPLIYKYNNVFFKDYEFDHENTIRGIDGSIKFI